MRKIVATGKHLDQCICHRFTLSFEALQEALDDSLKGLISVVKLALEWNLLELSSVIADKGVNFTGGVHLRAIDQFIKQSKGLVVLIAEVLLLWLAKLSDKC